MNYAPHLMWDPWTGKIVQFYPANQSASSLAHPAGTAETNRMGRVCIQIEVFFSPGAVRDGKRYDTVAETPCRGLPEIMAWLRSWGVADTWPSGWPQWSGNSRSLSNWRGKSGHFGHCHVPANDHTDPGPMPRTMFEEDDVPSEKEIWQWDGIEAPTDDKTGEYLNPKNPNWRPDSYLRESYLFIRRIHNIVAGIAAKDPADVDEDQIVQGVLAGLAPEKIAAAVVAAQPADMAKRVADEIGARLTGQQD